ncbi:SDR family oxidoreductase [Patulibacter sp. NPDC049589]|uniref:SDR family NAD(P)-dependent oxidoreductase n=1 Tax=Patulibacter sp. NPDC049589 TaxID=3154731 RepID=UPI003418F9B6
MSTTPIPPAKSYAESGVVIAGGTSGIGLASAHDFAAAGVPRIALLARTEARGIAAAEAVTAAHPGTEVTFVRVDAMDPVDTERAIAEAHAAVGTIDVLVSSVTSVYKPDLLHRTAIEDVAAILNAQALPPLHLTRAALPIMRGQRGGSIINIASDAAKTATPGESVLGAAMAAIVMFTRTVAIEGKRDGIRANAVTPSLVAGTPTAEMVLKDGFSAKLFEKAAAMASLGVAEPEDLAALIVFLGGPGASRLTGQAISVNGGISAA